MIPSKIRLYKFCQVAAVVQFLLGLIHLRKLSMLFHQHSVNGKPKHAYSLHYTYYIHTAPRDKHTRFRRVRCIQDANDGPAENIEPFWWIPIAVTFNRFPTVQLVTL